MRSIGTLSAAALAGLWLWRRRGARSGHADHSPGEPKRVETRLLETGAKLLQRRDPLAAMSTYLNGFHFYADDMGRQMEAHHYCSQVNEDLIQCAIFDDNSRDARLIGVEYIVSERLFHSLPRAEKDLWHSHHYETSSGSLVAPGLPLAVETELMRKLSSTYGKTWHTWDTHHHPLPLGIPALMMGFTADGQTRPELEEDRDRRLGVSTQARRRARSVFPWHRPSLQANAWQQGHVFQLTLERRERGPRRAPPARPDLGVDPRERGAPFESARPLDL